MTKSELKSIIMECLEEQGVLNEEATMDQIELEQAEIIEESCFAMLEAVIRNADGTINANASAQSVSKVSLKDLQAKKGEVAKAAAGKAATPEEAKQNAAKEVAKKLGSGFKAVGGKIVSTYSGKDGKGKQVAAIAATATALATSIGVIAASIVKKNKKKEEEENKNED